MHRTIFDYREAKKLPHSLCLIPFFGGTSDAVHASRVTNPIYYLKTLYSMRMHFERVITFVQNERDAKFLAALPGKSEIIQIECNPVHLPVSMLSQVQRKIEDFTFDYLFYTEADQILYTTDIRAMAEKCTEEGYTVPHRFVRLPMTDRPFFTTLKFQEQSPIVMFDGRPYEIRHYVGRMNPENERFYKVMNWRRAFGGAWLCNKDLFMLTEFRFVDYQPIEEACYSMFNPNERNMYRTYCPYDFFIDHLSGFEQVARDDGLEIETLPGAW